MRFDVEHPLLHAHLDRPIDDPNRRSHLDPAVQVADILGVEPQAAVADPAADAVGLVGSMDSVPLWRKAEPVIAEGVLRPGRHAVPTQHPLESRVARPQHL